MQLQIARRALALPLKLAPLLLIVVFSGLMTLAIYATLAGIPLAIAVLFGFINYSFVLLDGMITGTREPPVLSIEQMTAVTGNRALAILALVVALFFGTNAASQLLGPIVGVILGLAVVTLLPAMIAVQGLTGSVAQSMNIALCVRLMARVRSDYATSIVLIVLLYTLCCVVLGAKLIPLIASIALVMYCWLASTALIGSFLRSNEETLRLDDAFTPIAALLDRSEALERQRTRHLDQIYAEWRGGAHASAWKSILNVIQESPDPITELNWLYEHISRWPDARLVNRFSQEMVSRCLARNDMSAVIRILRERLLTSRDFRPRTSDELVRVALLTRDGGDRALARSLLVDFERLFPKDALQRQIEALRAELQ